MESAQTWPVTSISMALLIAVIFLFCLGGQQRINSWHTWQFQGYWWKKFSTFEQTSCHRASRTTSGFPWLAHVNTLKTVLCIPKETTLTSGITCLYLLLMTPERMRSTTPSPTISECKPRLRWSAKCLHTELERAPFGLVRVVRRVPYQFRVGYKLHLLRGWRRFYQSCPWCHHQEWRERRWAHWIQPGNQFERRGEHHGLKSVRRKVRSSPTVSSGHLRVNLSDNVFSMLSSVNWNINRATQADVSMTIRRGNLKQSNIDGDSTGSKEIRYFRKKDRDETCSFASLQDKYSVFWISQTCTAFLMLLPTKKQLAKKRSEFLISAYSPFPSTWRWLIVTWDNWSAAATMAFTLESQSRRKAWTNNCWGAAAAVCTKTLLCELTVLAMASSALTTWGGLLFLCLTSDKQ